jgi:hypothetical protein
MFSTSKSLKNTNTNTVTDTYFKNTIFLLHADGTNGANNTTYTDNSSYAGVISRGTLLNSQGSFSPYSPYGYSVYFNGTTDSVSYTTYNFNIDAASGGTTGDFTAECWIYPTAYVANTLLFCIGIVNNNQTLSCLVTSGTGTTVRLGFSGNDTVTSATPTLHAWTHVAVVRSAGIIAIYFNGTSQTISSSTAPTGSIGGNGIYLGYEYFSGRAGSFQGYNGNFRLANTAVYTGNFTSPSTTLSTTQTASTNINAITSSVNTHALFNGSRFADFSVNNFLVTPLGSNLWVLPFTAFSGVTYTPSQHGGSLYHASATDWVGTTTAVIATATTWPQLGLGGEDFGIEFWCYPLTPTTATQYFFSNYSADTNQRGLRIGVSSTTGVATLTFNGATAVTNSPQVPIYANSWTHVAVTRQSNTLNVFQNGQLVASQTDNSVYNIPAFTVGNSTYARNAATVGYTTDVRITRAIAPYFGSNFTPPTSALQPNTGVTTSATDTVLMLNFNTAGLYDATGRNNITYGAAGGAVIPSVNTSFQKFGTGAVGVMGAGFMRIPNSPIWDFGNGDFIIDFWFWPTSVTTLQTIYSKKAAAANFGPVQTNVSTTGKVITLISTSGAATTQTLTAVASIAISTWNYVSVYRSGVSIVQSVILANAFVDTQTNGTLSTTALAVNTADFTIGNQSNAASQPMLGYVDEFRVTRGTSRGYTTSSLPTAPTAAPPNQ